MSGNTIDPDEFTRVLRGIGERAADHDDYGSFPHEAFAELHRIGVLNLTVPTEAGGGFAALATVVDTIGAVGAADPSVALVLAMHLLAHAELGSPDNEWPSELRRAVQDSSIADVALINALRVEPDLGTPARGGLPATTAHRPPTGGHFAGTRPTPREFPVCAGFSSGLAPMIPNLGSAVSWCPPRAPATAWNGPGTTSACAPPAATT